MRLAECAATSPASRTAGAAQQVHEHGLDLIVRGVSDSQGSDPAPGGDPGQEAITLDPSELLR